MPVIRIKPVGEETLVQRFDRQVRDIEIRIAKLRQELRHVRREARASGIDMLAYDFQRRLAALEAQRRAVTLRALSAYRTQLSLDLGPADEAPDAGAAAQRSRA